MMQFLTDIQQIIRQAQQNVYNSINKVMLQAYWLVGKRIIEEEQQGESRAAYGAAVIKTLSEQLQHEFGKGFSVRNIQQMRLFYLEYPIAQTVSAQLDMPETAGTQAEKLVVVRPRRVFVPAGSLAEDPAARD